MTDPRRRPDEFLDEVRDMRARRDQRDDEPLNPAAADQIHAAGRDARRMMHQAPVHVVDVDVGEREEALILALAAAAERRGLWSSQGLNSPRPEVIDGAPWSLRRLRHPGAPAHGHLRAVRVVHLPRPAVRPVPEVRAATRRTLSPPGAPPRHVYLTDLTSVQWSEETRREAHCRPSAVKEAL
jgi:hypothetical protein